jgi:hypothetical protein
VRTFRSWWAALSRTAICRSSACSFSAATVSTNQGARVAVTVPRRAIRPMAGHQGLEVLIGIAVARRQSAETAASAASPTRRGQSLITNTKSLGSRVVTSFACYTPVKALARSFRICSVGAGRGPGPPRRIVTPARRS